MSERAAGDDGSVWHRRLLALIAIILTIGALHVMRPVTLPLAMAAFVLILVWPVESWLEMRVPRWFAITLTMLGLLLVLALLLAALWWSVRRLADRGPEFADRLESMGARLRSGAEESGLPLDGLEETEDGGWGARLSTLLATIAGWIPAIVSGVVLAGVYVVLGLLELRQLAARIRARMPRARAERLLETVARVSREVRRFLIAIGAAAGLAGIVTAVVGLAFGLELALIWGLVATVLDVVPVIGPTVAVLPPTLMAVVQFDDAMRPLAILGITGLLQFTIGWFVEPKIAGRVLALSPFGLLVAIAFWGWVWGPLGALLAAPITVALVVGTRDVRGAEWVGTLLARPRAGGEG